MFSTAPDGELKFHTMYTGNISLNITRFISYCIYFASKQEGADTAVCCKSLISNITHREKGATINFEISPFKAN